MHTFVRDKLHLLIGLAWSWHWHRGDYRKCKLLKDWAGIINEAYRP